MYSGFKQQAQQHKPIKGWVRSILILPAHLIFASLFQLAGYLVLDLDFMSDSLQKTPLQSLIINLFTFCGTLTIVGFFLHFIDKQNFRSVGFYPEGFHKETTIGLVLGASIIAVGFVILILINGIQWVGITFIPSNFIYGIFLFISVAVGEELLMRGYILRNLMKSMHRLIALLISSALFSLMHIINPDFSWMSFWNILLTGILLGLPYIYTKSLYLPIALHFSWNFFQGTIFGFNVSGQPTYSLIKQTRTIDNLWNGGKFGFEGSVLSIVFQIVAISSLCWYYEKKLKIASITPASTDM